MKSFTVKTNSPYEVIIDYGWKSFPKNFFSSDKILIVTDENISALYLNEVAELFSGKVYTVTIPAGENGKNLDNYKRIIEFLYEKDFSRKDYVVALGGGVVGDLSGFVASTFKRGLRFYQIPTTIIGMIDSSVGGKTAVNIGDVKNAVGTFYQPNGVYVNMNLIKTLPETELNNGLGEFIKYTFLSKEVSAKNYSSKNRLSEEDIYTCLKVKADVVEKDEKDYSLRALLNLGHTVGHAIESLSNFTIPHGICVFKGLVCAVKISSKLYGFSKEKTDGFLGYLNGFGLDGDIVFKKDLIVERIKADKKVFGDEINTVCIYDFGDCRIEKIKLALLGELL